MHPYTFPIIEFDEASDLVDLRHTRIHYVVGLGDLLQSYSSRIAENHHQTLSEIAETGLGWVEVLAILEDRPVNSDDVSSIAKTKVMAVVAYHQQHMTVPASERRRPDKHGQFVRPRYLDISAHCRDLGIFALLNHNGETIAEQANDYVPTDLGIGGGDDVIMRIDLDTGQVVNWSPPSHNVLQQFIRKNMTK